MTIQKDSGEILALLYKNKVDGKENLQQQNIEEITQWGKDRATFALEYLIRKGLIDGQVHRNMGSTKTSFIHIRDIEPRGIDTIENEEEFKETFGFTINLGLLSFSWSNK